MNNSLIRDDGYIHATSLCKIGGKIFSHWYMNKTTKKMLDLLSKKLNIASSKLIIATHGGSKSGTWVHPLIATNIAQWISVEFSLDVSLWIEEWKTLNNNKNRYIEALHNIKSDDKDDKEFLIQQKLLNELGGEIEVQTAFGRIDLLTTTEIIEIKNGHRWNHGLGQLLSYASFYPNHIKRLHVFDIIHSDEIDKLCKTYNVRVTYEPLDLNNSRCELFLSGWGLNPRPSD